MQVAHLLVFGRSLKDAGIRVSVGQVIDAGRALEFIDLACRADFYTALRANLISRKEEIPLFDRLFDSFWQDRRPAASPAVAPAVAMEETIQPLSGPDATLMKPEEASDEGSAGSSACSPIEI